MLASLKTVGKAYLSHEIKVILTLLFLSPTRCALTFPSRKDNSLRLGIS